MRTCAVDVGSGYTQYYDGKQDGSMPSIVCYAPDRLGFGQDGVSVVEFDGKRFLVGEDAASIGNPSTYADTLADNWAGQEPWKALMYASLAELGIVEGEVKLVTGLPQAVFQQTPEAVDALLAFLNGDHTFVCGGIQHTLSIGAMVIPQAAGAFFYQAGKDTSVLKSEVRIIDVGTYTAGLSAFNHGRPIEYMCGGEVVGVSDLSKTLLAHLETQHNHRTRMDKAPEILLSGQFTHRGELVDIHDEIETLTLGVSRPMLAKIREIWGSADDSRVFLAGGGAPFFKQVVQSVIPHAVVVDQPFHAVVRGMFSYAAAY